MPGKNTSNLIPQAHVLTVEEQSKGGIRSAEVRQQRKKAKDIAEIILALPVSKGKVQDVDDLKSLDAVNNIDTLTAMIVQAVKKAMDGSYRHMELLLTLTGDYSRRLHHIIPSDHFDDDASREYENYFKSLTYDWITGNSITLDELEEIKQADEVEEDARLMYQLYSNLYHLEIGSYGLSQEEKTIAKMFADADDHRKLCFIQAVYKSRKVPIEDAILLFDTTYKPNILKKYNVSPGKPVAPQRKNQSVTEELLEIAKRDTETTTT